MWLRSMAAEALNSVGGWVEMSAAVACRDGMVCEQSRQNKGRRKYYLEVRIRLKGKGKGRVRVDRGEARSVKRRRAIAS